ncbi:sensor histidine kinase [Methylobacterium nonmethylotrophicum]|uniref:histidine kinase n=1 Tax=Methylobacterium nonmethylotrophicum TaxID=1141884 RepID=A0A4Z0NPK4_9HYPH|nr:PAS domain-containing sensor histidine kinase [Methylobacterium nonmethylotrophicum]TGD98578.1 histidine kinase [Methylobacterium nonmethylotrophicum]
MVAHDTYAESIPADLTARDEAARRHVLREEAARLRVPPRDARAQAGRPALPTGGFPGSAADWEARLATAEELNARLRASEAFTARLLAASRDSIQVLALDGTVQWVSEGGRAAPDEAVVGTAWAASWPEPGDRVAADVALAAARADRTGRFRAPSGSRDDPRWWDVVVSPIHGPDGHPERLLAVARDVTEAHRAEEQQALLMQEMAHRVKNTLALVQAVATQTLRSAPTVEAAMKAFNGRLMALSDAHDVLIRGAWAAADLAAVVEAAMAPHIDAVAGRVIAAGPGVSVGPRSVLTLSLMLHELATNAAKYGALSSPSGRVAITWDLAGADDRVLRLRWQESGGPAVAPPSRGGFGSRLIERSLVHSFGGRVSLRYPPVGVVMELEAPLAAMQEGTA